MLNEQNFQQENIDQSNIIEQRGGETQIETDFPFPSIASFWRRFFAWFIDTIILGVIGLIIGAIFSSFLFKIGPYGRPIGLLFIIPYFGIMNSKIGGGQTIGKRLLKISVRNKKNEHISLRRSIVRILVLTTPALLNGWSVPLFQNVVISWLLSLVIFGFGGAIIYTMVFNQKTRQGIHDLLLGTYVIHAPGKPISSLPITSRVHWIVTWVWICIVAIGALIMVILSPSFKANPLFASSIKLYNIIQEDPRFFTVGVNDHTLLGSDGKTSHLLIIDVWSKGKPGENEYDGISKSIVKSVLESGSNLEEYDGIQVRITSAYDIGIARANITMTYSDSIEDWRNNILLNNTTNGFIPSSATSFLSTAEGNFPEHSLFASKGYECSPKHN